MALVTMVTVTFNLRRTNSWSESIEDYRFWAEIREKDMQESEREAHSNHMRLVTEPRKEKHNLKRKQVVNTVELGFSRCPIIWIRFLCHTHSQIM